jgi:hypothetical protein
MGLDFSGDPDGSAHLRQRCLGLGQPEGHLHGTIHLDRRDQRGASLCLLAHRGIQPTYAVVAVSLEGAHAQFLGQNEGLLVVVLGWLNLWGLVLRGEVAEES